jgi:YesN/AraC family two-component response regulator
MNKEDAKMSKSLVKLLIVDDEDNVRKGIETYIRLNSKRISSIYTAENGEEALEKIFQYQPELMLIDVQMPYKDGLTVMKEAKAAGICPKTIILSGYDEFQYAQKAVRYGAVDYLLKPCRPTEILAKLESLIEDGTEKDDAQDANVRENEKQSNHFVDIAVDYINEHYMENLTLTSVAEKVGVTSAYLSTLFTQTLGYGFIDYLNKVRIERASSYLHNFQLKNYEIAYKVGFRDEKYFTKVFKKVTGLSPSEYRKTL